MSLIPAKYYYEQDTSVRISPRAVAFCILQAGWLEFLMASIPLSGSMAKEETGPGGASQSSESEAQSRQHQDRQGCHG
jgi:hypothetical protein